MIYQSPCDDLSIPDVALHEFVLDALRIHGDRVVILDGPSGRALTAAQIVVQVDRVAAALARRGLQKGGVLNFTSN